MNIMLFATKFPGQLHATALMEQWFRVYPADPEC